MSRDVWTYEGAPTTFDNVVRGHMYGVRWYTRWTQPSLTLDRSIRHDPGGVPLGTHDRLLCVADRTVSKR